MSSFKNKSFYALILFFCISVLTGCNNQKSSSAKQASENKDINAQTEVSGNSSEDTIKPAQKYDGPRKNIDASTAKIPILMYHSINVNSTNNLIITPDEFEKQMQWLEDNKFTTLTLDEVYSILSTGENMPENPVAITFDDGYEDNYTYAFPSLKKRNFKATIFIITNMINKPSTITEDQMKEMYQNNIDFQSHTANHKELNSLSYSKQTDELSVSKAKIESILNKKVEYLCYPVGKYNDDTLKAAKECGYKMAVTTKGGQSKGLSDLYTLPRVRMTPGMSMSILKK